MEKETKTIFKNVDEYLSSQPEKIREGLTLFRETIRNVVPEAEELISYRMPAFKFHGMLVWYAAHKNHFGFYPKTVALNVFRERLANYGLSKGTIRFPYGQPLPVELISDIVRLRVSENLLKEALSTDKSRKKNK